MSVFWWKLEKTFREKGKVQGYDDVLMMSVPRNSPLALCVLCVQISIESMSFSVFVQVRCTQFRPISILNERIKYAMTSSLKVHAAIFAAIFTIDDAPLFRSFSHIEWGNDKVEAISSLHELARPCPIEEVSSREVMIASPNNRTDKTEGRRNGVVPLKN
uniref:Uncharacterized protein n=1 Tax=Vespula pensylvanica TaxID=30213 RepID=A0A834P4I3_VESPE|nr:hypothetical protein H0235_007353 [Vespula pensylvanica]